MHALKLSFHRSGRAKSSVLNLKGKRCRCLDPGSVLITNNQKRDRSGSFEEVLSHPSQEENRYPFNLIRCKSCGTTDNNADCLPIGKKSGSFLHVPCGPHAHQSINRINRASRWRCRDRAAVCIKRQTRTRRANGHCSVLAVSIMQASKHSRRAESADARNTRISCGGIFGIWLGK